MHLMYTGWGATQKEAGIMRGWLIATIVVLAMCLAPAAMATDAYWDCTQLGDINVYTYIFVSNEQGDWLKSFHVYAPVDPDVVTDWSADDGWSFTKSVDLVTGAADFCWYSATGLACDDLLQVSMTTAATVPMSEEYTLPQYLGNWAYESGNWPGAPPTVMDSGVGVPTGPLSATVPEPASILGLIAGCVPLIFRRRK